MTPVFLIVDALNLIRRVYAAQPGGDGPDRAEGALSATIGSLRRAVREVQPTHGVCVFDGPGRGWRYQRYGGYKAGRSPMPEALREALARFQEGFRQVGFSSVSVSAVEADDVIATLAHKMSSRGGQAVILSTDKIFLQLLSEQIRVRDHFRQQELDRDFVLRRFGVLPEQLVDYLALAGEPTNNIKGIPGIGPKTAAGLLQRFGDLDRIRAASGEIKGRVGRMLREHAEALLASRELVSLRKDLELGWHLKSFRLAPGGRASGSQG